MLIESEMIEKLVTIQSHSEVIQKVLNVKNST